MTPDNEETLIKQIYEVRWDTERIRNSVRRIEYMVAIVGGLVIAKLLLGLILQK